MTTVGKSKSAHVSVEPSQDSVTLWRISHNAGTCVFYWYDVKDIVVPSSVGLCEPSLMSVAGCSDIVLYNIGHEKPSKRAMHFLLLSACSWLTISDGTVQVSKSTSLLLNNGYLHGQLVYTTCMLEEDWHIMIQCQTIYIQIYTHVIYSQWPVAIRLVTTPANTHMHIGCDINSRHTPTYV